MSDQYKAFIRQFRAVCAAQRMDTKEVAAILGVHRTTIYNWWTLKTVMDGDSVLRCIKAIMGGCVKC